MWSDKYIYKSNGGIFETVSERLYWFLVHRHINDSSVYRYREDAPIDYYDPKDAAWDNAYEDDIPF